MGNRKNPTGLPPKVCIIDDDSNIREIYEKKFSLEGFQVFVAADGAQGIEVIRKMRPDIILLDLQMPVKDGFEVLKILSVDQTLVNMPVIILTNLNTEDILRKIGHLPIRFHLIIKSMITPEKAVDYVQELLDKQKAESTGKRLNPLKNVRKK